MSLIDFIKEKTGRKLTPKEMGLCEKGQVSVSKPFVNKRQVKEYKKGSFHGEPILGFPIAYSAYVVIDRQESYRATPDFSYGWKRPHWDWNSDKSVTRVYSAVDGLLVEEVIVNWHPPFEYERKTKRYDPRGRFFGKIV